MVTDDQYRLVNVLISVIHWAVTEHGESEWDNP